MLLLCHAGNAITKCVNGNSCIARQLTDANTPNGDRGIDGAWLLVTYGTINIHQPLCSSGGWVSAYCLDFTLDIGHFGSQLEAPWSGTNAQFISPVAELCRHKLAGVGWLL